MSEISIAMAKLAGIQKAVQSALYEDISRHRNSKEPQFPSTFDPEKVGHYFNQSSAQLGVLKKCMPEWYGDFHALPSEPETLMAPTQNGAQPMHFSRGCRRRFNIDHPCRLNFDQGLKLAV